MDAQSGSGARSGMNCALAALARLLRRAPEIDPPQPSGAGDRSDEVDGPAGIQLVVFHGSTMKVKNAAPGARPVALSPP